MSCDPEPKSPCCNEEMVHVPDCIHFHYQCERCCKEFELDGITAWDRKTYMLNKKVK